MKIGARPPLEVHAQLATSKARVRADEVIPGFARPGPAADRHEWNSAFEDAYASVLGDLSLVPWSAASAGQPDPSLVAWLDSKSPGLVRPGASVVVVGAGAGDDAAELAARGYDVNAFDVSPTAVEWARRRFPHIADCFRQADLLCPPRAAFCSRADLVVEVETLSWLPADLRPDAAAAIAGLARPRGMVLVVASPSVSDGAPGLMQGELADLMAAQGMAPLEPLDRCATEDGRLCAAFRRG